MCNLRMSQLKDPIPQIYAALFITTGVIAALGNTMTIIVIWMPGQRIKSNRILTSLVISDALVGYILSPINTYQVINKGALNNCTVDIVRAYFTILLVGSSSITLGIISYDRYLVLTKLSSYNRSMSTRKMVTLLSLAWAIPALTPILRVLGKKVYLPMVFAMFATPLCVSVVNYAMITKVIYDQEKWFHDFKNNGEKLKQQRQQEQQHQQQKAMRNTDNGIAAICRVRPPVAQLRHIKLAKVVSLLVFCYLICLLPLMIWIVLDYINYFHQFIDEKPLQIFYILSIFTAAGNSCLNPCIYVWKNPEFKKSSRKLFGKTRIHCRNV